MSALTIGGTQSGGTSKTLTPAGQDSGGRYRFAFPEHTALTQRLLYVGVKTQPVTKTSLGASEATIDFALTNAEASEGCCNVTSGGVYVNVKLRWTLDQPDTLVDTAIDYLQGAAFATFLEDAIKKGLITL